MPGVYIHIPFCRQACNYCDFHFSTNLSDQDKLVDALVLEIVQRQQYLPDKDLGSIYFGGGTPSLLSVMQLQKIFAALSRFFHWDHTSEVTLEANPDDISEELLRQWLFIGINRLSIGLQTFDESELKWMNRAHTAQQSLQSVKLARAAGFSNISIDLIYGSRFQTLDSWRRTLQTAIDLGTQHISSYNLTIEKKTVLGAHHQKGLEPAVNDTLSQEQFLLMVDMLEAAGFEHYEVSNFALPGYRAVHNSNYWLQQPYLGLGPSAHSFNGTSRQWSVKSNALYIKAVNAGSGYSEKEELTVRDRYNEYVLTRLRTSWGCSLQEIKNDFGAAYGRHFMEKTAEYRDFLFQQGDMFRLTTEGKLRADGIASDFFIL